MMLNIFVIFLLGNPVYAENSNKISEKIKRSSNSFNELSDISRNVTEKLKEASKKNDMERVQCISSRQVSITALVDISRQAQATIQSSLSKQDFVRIDTEYRKVSVALRKAKQYQAEVESCLSSQASSSKGESRTLIQVDQSTVADLLVGDEASFALDNVTNQVRDLESQTTVSSASSGVTSEDTPPPPSTSPFE